MAALAPPPFSTPPIVGSPALLSLAWLQWFSQGVQPGILSIPAVPTTGTGYLHDDGTGTRVWRVPTASEVGAEPSGAVAAHALLQTGVHGISIAAGKVFTASNSLTVSGTDGSALNIGTGGTLRSAAFQATSAFLASTNPDFGGVLNAGGTQVLTTRQTGMPATPASRTASATYGATEQTMIQEAHDIARLLLAAIKVHGAVS